MDMKNRVKTPKHYFSRAIRKYGWENFTKEILIDEVPEEDLDNLEINYIAFYDSLTEKRATIVQREAKVCRGINIREEQCMAHSKRRTKNHSVEGGGTVCFEVAKTSMESLGFPIIKGTQIYWSVFYEGTCLSSIEIVQ